MRILVLILAASLAQAQLPIELMSKRPGLSAGMKHYRISCETART